ncbi:MAG: hypothetical protein HDR77_07280 [Bacteroides sp.]|nr:hypothetical protein [Bacteroides sp.]
MQIIKSLFTAVCLSFAMTSMAQTPAKNEIRFGIVSDLHHDIMHDAPERLNDFLEAAKKNQVDFIIDLGDFCFVKKENRNMVDLWNSYPGEKYHVIGNHDMDNCNKDEYMDFLGIDSRYYSFDKGDFHFIVLDANNLYSDSIYTPYAYGNFYVDMSKREFIDDEQIEWLKSDLINTDKKCIIFSHQCLENTVGNREEIRKILEDENERAGFKKVVAAFSGHDHTNYEKVINGIVYVQINSASNQWVGDDYECDTRFSEEIYARRPSLKKVVPWKDCLYAIVNLNDSGFDLQGKESEFIAPTPADLKIPADFFPYPLVPYIKDFKYKF